MNKINKKNLLTLEDLYNFFSLKKKSMSFDADKTGYNIAVQVKGTFEVNESDDSEGLLYCKVKAFHDLSNKNKSHIDTDVLEKHIQSMKDRPIMADIIDINEEDEYGNKLKDFNGHTMEYDSEKDKIIYIEKPVGHFVKPEDFHTVYDETYERNFVIADAVIYEEYTDTCEILRRRKEVDCSVELCIRSMAWNCANKELNIEDFYVQGCTLLGAHVQPGMTGSKLSLKDFSESNNSLFSTLSEDENFKLIDTLDKLNDTLSNLSKFNIEETKGQRKEGQETVVDEKKEVKEVTETEEVEVEKTETEATEEEVTVTETESKTDDAVEDTPKVVENEACGKKKECSEDEKDIKDVDDTEDDTEDNTEIEKEPTEDEACKDKEKYDDGDSSDSDSDDTDTTEESSEETVAEENPEDAISPLSLEPDEEPKEKEACGDKKKKFAFELSHDDVRCGLYELLQPYCESDNDWYWISEVFDTYFVYEGCFGKIYRQNYSKNEDVITFDGDRTELFRELLTEAEKVELETMRSNYSSIKTELNGYKEAELMSKKEEVLADEAYANFAETEEFKAIKEKINEYSLDDLKNKCELAFASCVRKKGNFSLTEKETEKKETKAFAFATPKHENSFLDGLLKK